MQALILPLIAEIKKFESYTVETKGKYGSTWTHAHNFNVQENLRDDLGEKSPYELYVESGKVTEESFEIFYDYVPYDVHSITEVEVVEVNSIEKLL